jgi:hypothetical protein
MAPSRPRTFAFCSPARTSSQRILPQVTHLSRFIYNNFFIVDCTDLVSASDHHVCAELKRIMSLFYKHELGKNRTAWCDLDKGRSESERRIKMAQWAAYAWLIVLQKTDFTISIRVDGLSSGS